MFGHRSLATIILFIIVLFAYLCYNQPKAHLLTTLPNSMDEVGQHWPQIAGLGLLLLLSAFFSGSETAFCALSRTQLERFRLEDRKSSLAIVRFLDNPHRLFITVLLGNTFINTAFATITASLIGTSSLQFVVGTILITLLLLIFGEVTPKTYAIEHAEQWAHLIARPLWWFSILISPFRSVLRVIINLLIPIFGGSDSPVEKRITAEDLKELVGRDDSGLQTTERDLLSKILQMSEIEAKEVMVPRTSMISADSTVRIQQLTQTAQQMGVSRIPIYRGYIDNTCGVFHVKDLPHWSDIEIQDLTVDNFLKMRQSSGRINSLIRLPFHVPETKHISDLLRELTEQKTKMAILLDEYGGVSGLVTLEDLIEEIVGDIVDEHDTILEWPEILPADNPGYTFEISGRTSVRAINQELSLKFDEDIADTIGGYALSLYGHIPSVGETVEDDNAIRFEVTALDGNQVSALILTLPPISTES